MSDYGDDEGRATPESHGSASARRQRALLAASAAVMVVVALGLPGSGCLNPRPEELPSADATQANTPEGPVRETCDDNPLLAGCDLPDQDINADPIDEDDSPAPGETPSNLGGEGAPEPSAPGDEAPVGGGGADGDAGAPADAGPP